MQILANKLYPGLNRKIYVNAYRYSLNMLPKSLLIEVGAQTNSKQEALNAIDFLADILAKVLLDEWLDIILCFFGLGLDFCYR